MRVAGGVWDQYATAALRVLLMAAVRNRGLEWSPSLREITREAAMVADALWAEREKRSGEGVAEKFSTEGKP